MITYSEIEEEKQKKKFQANKLLDERLRGKENDLNGNR